MGNLNKSDYLALFGNKDAAIEYEDTALSIGNEYLPECAQAVRDGAEPTPEYWQWLCNEVERTGIPTTSHGETTFITNDVQIIVESIEELHENGKSGDARVALCVADGVDGNRWPFLRTNGNPVVITEDGGNDSCDIEAAAEGLGVTKNELIAMVKESIPGIDWPNCDEITEPANVLAAYKICCTSNGEAQFGDRFFGDAPRFYTDRAEADAARDRLQSEVTEYELPENTVYTVEPDTTDYAAEGRKAAQIDAQDGDRPSRRPLQSECQVSAGEAANALRLNGDAWKVFCTAYVERALELYDAGR